MKVIDKILNEWSFRCHDGIVDMNDPKKVSILNEIMLEEGIDDDIMDATLNLPKDDPSSEEKKQKALAVLTGATSETGISDAIAALNDEEKQKVLKYINNKFKEELKDYSELEKKIENKIDNSDATDIISALAIKMGEGDKLLEYLTFPDKQLSFNLGQKTGELLNILEKTNLNKNFLARIVLFAPSEGNKNLGVGEIALELFFKDAKKASTGDIKIDEKLIELKSQGARFPGKGEGRSGDIKSLYSDFQTTYPKVKLKSKESSLGLYINNIINSLPEDELKNGLEYINNKINKIYPNTENIKIEVSDVGNINKKLIKKYIASYIALHKDNDYYMLISNQLPFKYTLYTPEELINNSDNLSFTSNITPSNSYPNLNLGQSSTPSDEEEIKQEEKIEKMTYSGKEYVSAAWFNKQSKNIKQQFDNSNILKQDNKIWIPLKSPEDNKNLTEELTDYLIKSLK
jgi:hypothetical protein